MAQAGCWLHLAVREVSRRLHPIISQTHGDPDPLGDAVPAVPPPKGREREGEAHTPASDQRAETADCLSRVLPRRVFGGATLRRWLRCPLLGPAGYRALPSFCFSKTCRCFWQGWPFQPVREWHCVLEAALWVALSGPVMAMQLFAWVARLVQSVRFHVLCTYAWAVSPRRICLTNLSRTSRCSRPRQGGETQRRGTAPSQVVNWPQSESTELETRELGGPGPAPARQDEKG